MRILSELCAISFFLKCQGGNESEGRYWVLPSFMAGRYLSWEFDSVITWNMERVAYFGVFQQVRSRRRLFLK